MAVDIIITEASGGEEGNWSKVEENASSRTTSDGRDEKVIATKDRVKTTMMPQPPMKNDHTAINSQGDGVVGSGGFSEAQMSPANSTAPFVATMFSVEVNPTGTAGGPVSERRRLDESQVDCSFATTLTGDDERSVRVGGHNVNVSIDGSGRSAAVANLQIITTPVHPPEGHVDGTTVVTACPTTAAASVNCPAPSLQQVQPDENLATMESSTTSPAVTGNPQSLNTSYSNQSSPKQLTARIRRSRMQREIADYHPSSKCAPSGATANGQHCIIHTPTLEELRSTSFSNFVRHTVLPAASVYEVHRCDGPQHHDYYYMSAAMELREGMAKVRLPTGFFPSAPYQDDTTGRGPAWQAGTKLGDWPFTSPIQQNIRGMAGIYEYTHTELPATTLAAFRVRADKYRRDQMGSALLEFKNDDDEAGVADIHTASGGDQIGSEETLNNDNMHPGDPLTEAQIAGLERQFWKRLSPTMPPAVYGADEAGSLFGDDPASGWSLAKLDSCLHVLSDIPGVTSPYLYAGMWATVFCAHAEDMNLLSINFLHAGQPKLWYAVAEQDAARFVSLAEHHFIHQLKKCKEFLRHKLCLLSPAILRKAGIRYQTAVQYPGDAIITFPGGYHFGFNAGFNVAEATNFGVPEWLPFGRRAKVCLCRPDSVRIDMNRLSALLQRYQKDQKRNRRLTWKEWRKRQERKEGVPSRDSVKETAGEIIEVISYTSKKRARKKKDLLSEQQRKKEFWIEVMQPLELKKLGKKRGATKIIENPWHLAKPSGRKRFEVQTRVLCLVPIPIQVPPPVCNDSNDSSDEEMPIDEEEQCFAGTVIEISEGHVLIHFDGKPKTEDMWMPVSSPKLFVDGGRWEEEQQLEGIPPLHYWKEIDSKNFTS